MHPLALAMFAAGISVVLGGIAWSLLSREEATASGLVACSAPLVFLGIPSWAFLAIAGSGGLFLIALVASRTRFRADTWRSRGLWMGEAALLVLFGAVGAAGFR